MLLIDYNTKTGILINMIVKSMIDKWYVGTHLPNMISMNKVL